GRGAGAMWTRAGAWLLPLALVMVGAPGASGQAADRRGLELDFIDVMGGAATLLVTPERESILIDSGWPGYDDRDPRRIVHALRDLARRTHLDPPVPTH